MYSVRYLDAAITDFEALGHTERRGIVAKIDWLAENAADIPHKSLTAELRGLYKFRVGNYRVLYELSKREKIVIIHAVGHRREIYRNR